MIIKNQFFKLKKRFKTAINILHIMSLELLYKNKIHENTKLMNI